MTLRRRRRVRHLAAGIEEGGPGLEFWRKGTDHVKKRSPVPRALAALRIADHRGIRLCSHCEGALLYVAGGVIPPRQRGRDGKIIDTAAWAEHSIYRILLLGAGAGDEPLHLFVRAGSTTLDARTRCPCPHAEASPHPVHRPAALSVFGPCLESARCVFSSKTCCDFRAEYPHINLF